MNSPAANRESRPPLPISIFNDVIGPVMRGASSSHCAAALRIGRLARDLMEGEISEVLVELDRNGALPTTHESQGSDMGLFGGLLGWDAADERLPHSPETVRNVGIKVRIEIVDAEDPHPNTYRLTLRNASGQRSLRAISVGGGMIEVIRLDNFDVSLVGDTHVTLLWIDGVGVDVESRLATLMPEGEMRIRESGSAALVELRARDFLGEAKVAELRKTFKVRAVRRLAPVLPVESQPQMAAPFTTCEAMMRSLHGQEVSLWRLAVRYECARGCLTEDEVLERMLGIVRILRRSIDQGIKGTSYDDRVLAAQSPAFDSTWKQGRLLDGGGLNRILLYVSSLMEVKSSMGVIVAAPTAGACAALPGAVIGMAEERGLTELDMAKAMLAAGLIGVFIAARWTFAAEVGGCQAEGGAAACMAGAALVGMAGGTLAQSIAAASTALQNMLGLVCDPVANRVEVPCLGKNVMAASNALACANLALAGFDPVIPLDEVIEAARQISQQMPRELRCTGLGGLAVTPASRAIVERLAASRATCGQCGA